MMRVHAQTISGGMKEKNGIKENQIDFVAKKIKERSVGIRLEQIGEKVIVYN